MTKLERTRGMATALRDAFSISFFCAIFWASIFSLLVFLNIARISSAQEYVACFDIDDELFELTPASDTVDVFSVNLLANAPGDSSSFSFEDYAKNKNQFAVARVLGRVTNEDLANEGLQNRIGALRALDETGITNGLQSLSAAHRANVLTLALNSPWRSVFNTTTFTNCTQVDASVLCVDGVECRGQANNSGACYIDCPSGYSRQTYCQKGLPYSIESRIAWANADYRGTKVRADHELEKYDISETGMNLGYAGVHSDGVVGGFVFGYSRPRLRSYNAQTNATNFQLGFYAGGTLLNVLETSFYLGGGFQDYSTKRMVIFSDGDDLYRSKYDGQSLATALRIARTVRVDAFTIWRPIVQFDYQQVWLDDAKESGEGLSLSYEKADWNQVFVRAGLEAEWSAPLIGFVARVLYARRLNDSDSPRATSSFSGTNSALNFASLGAEQDKSFFECGITSHAYLDAARRLGAFGSYDAILSKRATTNLASLGISYVF